MSPGPLSGAPVLTQTATHRPAPSVASVEPPSPVESVAIIAYREFDHIVTETELDLNRFRIGMLDDIGQGLLYHTEARRSKITADVVQAACNSNVEAALSPMLIGEPTQG